MKRANSQNINFRSYWNDIYKDDVARTMYAAQGTDAGHLHHPKGEIVAQKTARFTTALTNVKKGDKVLDIGCGVGVFTTLVKRTYPENEVWGIDISDAVIHANMHNPEHLGIKYFPGYIGDLDLPKEYFDVIFCGETIEHLDDPNVLF